MIKEDIYDRTPYEIAFVLLVLVLCLTVIGCFLIFRLNQSRLVVNCNSFDSYADALKALPTHPGLDRNHKNGACEAQFGKHI